MKPNNMMTIAMLCALLVAGGAIVHNYSRANAALAQRSDAPSCPYHPFSAKLRAEFLSPAFPASLEEVDEFMSLVQHAREKHDVHEIHLIIIAHRQHLDRSLRMFYTEHPSLKHRRKLSCSVKSKG